MYPGVLDDIQRLFPAARITSGYRGPNNPLTRRNPSSAHTHGSPTNPGAVDVAPIPGVGFNDYVSRLKAAGIPVTGARDEQANPVAWTTGPNWHVSLDTKAPKVSAASPYYAPPPKEQPQMPNPLFQPPQPNLGDTPLTPQVDASHILSNLPALKGKSNTGDIIRTIIGALSDGALAYSGMNPMFAPAESQRQSDEQQMAFDREKFNAMLEEKRADALKPPQWLQDAEVFNQLPKPLQAQVLQYQDAMHPIFTATPQGTALNHRYNGPPPEAINELRDAVSKGDQGAIAEFEQVFGSGSASAYLGQ